MCEMITIKLEKDQKKELARLGPEKKTFGDVVKRPIQIFRKNSQRKGRART